MMGYSPPSVSDEAPIWKRTPLERRWPVRAGKAFARSFTSYFHDLRVLTPCTLPISGSAILVCNHTSSLDPVILQAACPRIITWMMAKEYGTHFGTQWFFNAIEPILVERRGRDMAATRAALRALKEGKILGLFPEGRIEPTPHLLEFQTGVALLALKSNAPVYPAYVDGTQRGKGMMEAFLRPNQITLAFGPQIPLDSSETDNQDSRDRLESATGRIRGAVAALSQLRLPRG
jgi:1-acyl-sn-glycerol-3-phosphate acyltransferase